MQMEQSDWLISLWGIIILNIQDVCIFLATAFKMTSSRVIFLFHRQSDNRRILHWNNSYRVIIEENCIQIILYRKNICENHTFYHTTNAYNFLWGACYYIDRSGHIPKPETLKYLTKAKLWNVVKYYSKNDNWTYFYTSLHNYMCNWGIFML